MHSKRIAILLLTMACGAFAEEGMWLFTQPPRELLRERYQFEGSDAWLEHLQKSSIRFSSGGSGSFVSKDGLLISNHHVGADALQKLSTKERNLMRNGFYAKTPADEIKCLDLELNVLQSIEDVTERVNAAVPAAVDPAVAFAARRKVIAGIEKESLDQTGLRSDVVTLWQGGAYHLYRFKRYTDVRVVFAPEEQIAFYGGDADNFEFPRHDLDICLFRAYEDGKPAKIDHYLKFQPKGAQDGELVFVSGHPGSTRRLLTVAELQDLRDQALPDRLARLKRREVLLANWCARSEENARRGRNAYFGTQNGRKALDGRLAGLLDGKLIPAKRETEQSFKAQLAGKSEFAAALGAYDKIAEATRIQSANATRRELLEGGRGFSCDSFNIARTLLRAGDERLKPDGERLKEFSESKRASLELGLFSERPIYEDLEILLFTDSLTDFAGQLGADDPLVVKVMACKSPRERARELIGGTKVRDVSFRHQLYDGGSQAVTVATDPMIELARLVDAEARALREEDEAQDEVKKQAHAAIAQARNRSLGTAGYPDATFTLRLAFGTVAGYEEDGRAIQAMTKYGSLYERAIEMKNKPPFDLPPLWEKRKSRLNPKTPFNFVSTCDIIGGNSGSPVLNRAGEFVGIIFDGNLQSLPWDYAFDDAQGRATSVAAPGIIEALKQVYRAKALVKELLTGSLD